MRGLASLLSSLAPSAGLAPRHVAGRENVTETLLANGMKLIVWSQRDIPNVALYNWVRVGSRNEVAGATGLAHFFEHMMFNGTRSRAPGEFDRMMESNGGSNNAYTSEDVTVYQDWFPRSALESVLALEADRLANLAFVDAIIERERSVVQSERRLRIEDNSAGALSEAVQSAAFVAHPYGVPVIGWPADIAAWTLDDLQSFFKTYYAPNNQTMVLAGDVDPDVALKLAQRYLEPIPRRECPAIALPPEPEQLGERRVSVNRVVQTGLLHYAYKAPPAADPRGPALQLLCSILSDGNASRLHRLLVEDRQIAIDVGSVWSEGFDPGLFWIYAAIPEDVSVATVEEVLDGELARIAGGAITQKELDRARNMRAASFWKQISTIDGKAQLAGEYEVIHGEWRKLFDIPDGWDSVSLSKLKDVAAGLLDTRRRTVGTLQGGG